MAQVALTYSYVYFAASGPHERRPVRTPGGPGGFSLIEQKSGGTLQTGDQFQIGIPFPATETVGGAIYNFAFVNVSGGTPSGSQVSFSNVTSPPAVTVESAPINVLVLYVPPPGGNGGVPGSGATINSFDETTGSLFNDVFVSVAPDAGGTLTASANNMGYVDTTNSEEAITAISPTSSGVVFDQWRVLSPPGPDAGDVLTVGKGVSEIGLAFYKAPPQPSPEQQACSQAVQFLQQIITDRGPLLPVAEYNEVKAALDKCVTERILTQAFVNNLLAEYATVIENRNNPPRT